MSSARKDHSILSEKILQGDRLSLSRAITLCESTLYSDRLEATALLEKLLPYTGNSIRIGITGVPGAGKSTFIEAMGKHLLAAGKKVAVLAVDPSSSRTGGSLMGDKTRMPELSNRPDAYVRPSSTGKTLGGIAAATHEAIFLCEAAGFDTILIETTGVGQSETLVQEMTDHFVLLLLTGAGDDIQIIKRGIMEVADTVVINKAEDQNLPAAKRLQAYLTEWNHNLPVHLVSSIHGTGVKEVWQTIEDAVSHSIETSAFTTARNEQNIKWMHQAFRSLLENYFYTNPSTQKEVKNLEERVSNSDLAPPAAALKLFEIFRSK